MCDLYNMIYITVCTIEENLYLARDIGLKLVLYKVYYFLFNNQQDAPIIPILFGYKTTCFGHVLCLSSGVLYCTFGTDKYHAVF